MAIKLSRTYGNLSFDKSKNRWLIENAEPHVCLKIKAVFPKLKKWEKSFVFANTPENCFDLLWFIDRYPLFVSEKDKSLLSRNRIKQIQVLNDLERILAPGYDAPNDLQLNDGFEPREYQLIGRDVFLKSKRMLIGDDTGLGKTAIAVFAGLTPGTLPMFVCVQTHMPAQWKAQIEKFTKLSVYIIKNGPVISLPKADIYIISYSKLGKWVDVFSTGFCKTGVFDEIQELRLAGSVKYCSAERIAKSCEFVLGLSATPIYNYSVEIFNIVNLIKPGCLGTFDEFAREWSGGGYNNGKMRVKDPAALGTYLRENFIFLRRTRKEVGRELPPVNTIIHTVGYDNQEVIKAEDIARELATKTLTGNFMERGQAARELDIFLRAKTGVSKAKEVAEYVKILLDNNEPIILAGWHRDVYDIWMDELSDYRPVLYTGSETPAQKEAAKKSFIEGETDCFIISLRSGIGLDGLQSRCKIVVFGELDWSPQVHHQVISRADRDGQTEQVTVIYLVSEYGSDPVIIELNGIKASLSKAIIDPLSETSPQYSDESRITKLAQQFLEHKKIA